MFSARNVRMLLSMGLVLQMGLISARAANTWQGTVDVYWTNAANWSVGLVPTNGEDVIIPNVANDPVMASGFYPEAGSFNAFEVQAGAIVVCRGETNCVNGGSVTNPYGTGVTIRCQSAVIAGTLNADTQGFPAWFGPGVSGTDPHAGSYGGNAGGAIAKTYGSMTQPTALGSGGQNYPGGGAIRLDVAGALQVNGTLTANGGDVGSAGGSLWITAGSFSGTGTVRARGGVRGVNPSWPGGGGGRVSVEYASSTFTGIVDVGGGKGCTPYYGENDGQSGTLWEPARFANVIGTAENPTNVTISHGFQYHFTNTTMRYWRLSITNNAWFEVHDGAMTLSSLFITNGTFRFDDYVNGRKGVSDMESVTITGNVFVAGDSDLHLPSGLYRFDSFTVLTNATAYLYGNTNSVNGGTVQKPHGTGVAVFCSSATIGGTLNADALGFPSASGPGYFNLSSLASSHGGQEGAHKGVPYGSPTRPVALGSGGYRYPGGGAIRVHVAGGCLMNGTITASGQPGSYGEGAAGGSVWLTADTLAGSGVFRARGANRGPNPSWPGGGGGRVALHYSSSTFAGSIDVAGGFGCATNYGESAGKTGTYVNCHWPAIPASSADALSMTLESSYVANNHTNSGTNGIIVSRVVTDWFAPLYRMTWEESLSDIMSNALAGTATYTVSGLPPNTKFQVLNDGEIVCATNSGSSGGFVFDVSLTNPAHVIAVFQAPKGTLFAVK